MATKNLWGISNVRRNVAPGWSAASIAHNDSLHNSVQSLLGPNTAQSQLLSTLTDKILGVNKVQMGTSIPAGVVTGTAQNLGNGGIPDIISKAIGNLQTNINTSNTTDILNKFLQAIGSRPAVQVNTTSPAMDEYYKNKNTIMAAPSNIQTNINAIRTAADKLQPKGVMSISPGIPGQYEGSVTQSLDRQLGQAYAAQTEAKKAAQSTGWLPYMPMY